MPLAVDSHGEPIAPSIEAFKTELEAHRARLGLTEEEFAGELGTSVLALQRWLSGPRVPGPGFRLYLLQRLERMTPSAS